ncbi:MAG: hypothetical protein COA47_16085 [Robiginitomaculum sp.]|nr:MAG: hypothetical protein COA47_16085 [Robiginitomaculum sp.]
MIVLFDNFTLDLDRRELSRDGGLIAVQPQVFDLLTYIVANPDRVVSRDDLIEHVWQGRIVSESTLATRINAARKALGDNGTDQRLIRTVRGAGIRFVGNIIAAAPLEAAVSDPIAPAQESVDLFLPEVTSAQDHPGLGTMAIALFDQLTVAFSGQFLYALRLGTPPKDAASTGYCLRCSIRGTGEQATILAKLTGVEADRLIWADQFTCPAGGDQSALELCTDKIINRVLADLALDRTKIAAAKGASSADPVDLFYNARRLLRTRMPEDYITAEKLLRRSVELQPDLYVSHMGLAILYLIRASGIWSSDPAGELERTQQSANKALSVNERAYTPVHLLAYVAVYQRQYDVAEDYVRLAESLTPSGNPSHGLRGILQSYQGNLAEALAHFEQGSRVDIDQKNTYVLNTGRAYFIAGDFNLAIPKLEQYARFSQAADLVQLILGFCYDATGNSDKARACVDTQLALCPFTSIKRISLVTPYPLDVLEQFNEFLRQYDVPNQ